MNTKSFASMLTVAALGLLACNKPEGDKTGAAGAGTTAEKTVPASATGAVVIDEKAAKETFDTRCAACHGTPPTVTGFSLPTGVSFPVRPT